MAEIEIIELSSEDEKSRKSIIKNDKKKLKTLRKDQKQPLLKNYFDVTSKNYFSTFSHAQLPAQVSNLFTL